jgi:uncharacterized membrane protein YdbT with pleckstrin-like domain
VDLISSATSVSAVFLVLGGGFFGGMLTSFLPTLANSLRTHVANPFLIIGLAVLVLFPIITLAVKWLNYQNTVYRVYPDRLEIEEGFLTQHRKEIRLASVRETNLRRSVLQRLVGLGSVYLATQATGHGQWWQASAILGGTSTFGSGAMLMDLADSEAAYQDVRALVLQAQFHAEAEDRERS